MKLYGEIRNGTGGGKRVTGGRGVSKYDAKTRDDGGASKSEPLGELGIPEPRGVASEEIFSVYSSVVDALFLETCQCSPKLMKAI